MKVFAFAPFRYPAVTGKDYPYGEQEIADDTLARTLADASLVRLLNGSQPQIVISSAAPVDGDGRPNGTLYIKV